MGVNSPEGERNSAKVRLDGGAHGLQDVASLENTGQPRPSGGRSRSHHSQFNRSASISASLDRRLDRLDGSDFLRGRDDAGLTGVELVERALHLVDDVERYHDGAVLVGVD